LLGLTDLFLETLVLLTLDTVSPLLLLLFVSGGLSFIFISVLSGFLIFL
jgi:hypothetical protein